MSTPPGELVSPQRTRHLDALTEIDRDLWIDLGVYGRPAVTIVFLLGSFWILFHAMDAWRVWDMARMAKDSGFRSIVYHAESNGLVGSLTTKKEKYTLEAISGPCTSMAMRDRQPIAGRRDVRLMPPSTIADAIGLARAGQGARILESSHVPGGFLNAFADDQIVLYRLKDGVYWPIAYVDDFIPRVSDITPAKVAKLIELLVRLPYPRRRRD